MDNYELLNSIANVLIYYVYVHPVQLKLVFEDLPNVYDELDERGQIDEDADNKLEIDEETKSFVTAMTWKTVVSECKILNVSSRHTGNKDIRGGGCGNLGLPVEEFRWKQVCPKGIRLQDLIGSIYRLKGSKYDYWYELLSEVHFTRDGNTLNAFVEFDYGS